MAQLAQQLGRTVPELYRMILVLGDRGYVQTEGHGFTVTSKAFCLALDRLDVQRVLTAAAPEMERLSRMTGQTCYLSAADDRFVVVIAAQPALSEYALDVRVGMRQPLLDTAAGQVHFGFQSDSRKEKWRRGLAETEDTDRLERFLKDTGRAALSGQAEHPHRHMPFLTEVSSPVTGPADRVFALSLLYMHHRDGFDLRACRSELSDAARRITQALRVPQASPGQTRRQRQPSPTPEVCE